MKVHKPLYVSALLLLAASIAAAASDEDQVRNELAKAFPATTFTSVARTPVPGLYEVWMNDTVAFVSDRDVRYLLFGRLFDTRTMQDLTATKLANAHSMQPTRPASAREEDDEEVGKLDPHSLADALVTTHGNGRRQLVVFSDPACPYCKRLEPELAKVDDVTIHTIVVPFQGETLPLGVVCAAEPAKAWHALMLDNDPSLLGTPTGCNHPLERNLALAQKVGVRGTPTLFFADGSRIAGYVSAAQIEARLSSVAAEKKP